MIDRFRPGGDRQDRDGDRDRARKARGNGRDKARPPGGGGLPPDRQRNVTIGWVLAAFLIFMLLQGPFGGAQDEVRFSRFLSLVGEGRVNEATITEGTVSGTYRGTEGEPDEVPFRTTMPPNYDTTQLAELLEEQGVDWTGEQPNPWVGLLFGWILPFGLIIGLYYFFIFRRFRNQMGGGGALQIGKNKAKLYDRSDMKTSFKDVAGVDEVEAELVELVDYLKNPRKYEDVGAHIPKGVLLVGPPGTGKTLLARAIAGEADVPFFYIAASEFIEMFVGLGAARMRDLFEQARQKAPAIIFMDEIDSIGQARSGAAGNQLGAHQEQEQTLQQLLTEMDGFEPNSGVIIVAASNRPEVLDKALLRPGRFDRQIVVNLPDIKGREEILRIHAGKVRLGDEVDLVVIARRTPGFSGAQLANIINEAALLAARSSKKKVDMVDIEEAIDRVTAGLERRSHVLSDKERRLVAYHELGHALVARFVDHADPVHRVSIIPRGMGALGYTQQLPEEERYLMSEPELRDMIAILLGGRSAEELVFGFATTGAQDDLKRATEIARRMVMEFGMSDKVGPINVADVGSRFLSPAFRQGENLSEETGIAIDREVKSILLGGQKVARAILAERRGDLDALSARLLTKETLDRKDLDDHFANGAGPATSPAPSGAGGPEGAPTEEVPSEE